MSEWEAHQRALRVSAEYFIMTSHQARPFLCEISELYMNIYL